jgi:hypothetical protein
MVTASSGYGTFERCTDQFRKEASRARIENSHSEGVCHTRVLDSCKVTLQIVRTWVISVLPTALRMLAKLDDALSLDLGRPQVPD